MRHFLNLSDAGADGVAAMLADAIDRKAARAGFPKGKADADAPLAGRVLAMIFEKNSTRTRVSFDVGVRQMGGQTMVLSGADMQLSHGETIADTARVMSRYVDLIMIRTFEEATLLEMAEHATVPVINGLAQLTSSCAAMMVQHTCKAAAMNGAASVSMPSVAASRIRSAMPSSSPKTWPGLMAIHWFGKASPRPISTPLRLTT